jgi:hypothetical protein
MLSLGLPGLNSHQVNARSPADRYRAPRRFGCACVVARGFGRQKPLKPRMKTWHCSRVAKSQIGTPSPLLEEITHHGYSTSARLDVLPAAAAKMAMPAAVKSEGKNIFMDTSG